MIGEIRKKLLLLKGKKIKVWVDIGRNKSETYEGIVKEVYDKIWILETSTDLKSFSYSDVLINNVVISS